MGKLKIQKSDVVNVGFDYNNVISGTIFGDIYIGGVGGNTNITGSQITVEANIEAFYPNGYPISHSASTAYIVAARGGKKFLVNDGTYQGVCVLVDKASGDLNPGEMSIQANHLTNGNFYVSRISNKFVWDFNPGLPNKYLWTGGERVNADQESRIALDVVQIPLS